MSTSNRIHRKGIMHCLVTSFLLSNSLKRCCINRRPLLIVLLLLLHTTVRGSQYVVTRSTISNNASSTPANIIPSSTIESPVSQHLTAANTPTIPDALTITPIQVSASPAQRTTQASNDSITSDVTSPHRTTSLPPPTVPPNTATESRTTRTGPLSTPTTRNCTTYSADLKLPCQPNGCFQVDAGVAGQGGGALDPCLEGNHQVVQSEGYTTYSFLPGRRLSPAPDVWTLFTNSQGGCMNILSAERNDTTCMLPGFCNSRFPWYIRLDRTLPTSWGEEIENSLCATDLTSRNTALCCQQPIKVVVRSCGFYFLYKFKQAMPKPLAGNICTANISTATGLRKWSPVSSVNMKYTAMNGQVIPNSIGQLSELERNNLVTVVFKLILPRRVNIRNLVSLFNSELIKVLINFSKKRTKRWGEQEASQLTSSNVKRVLGSPSLHSSNQILYYTFYVQTDTGEITPQSVLYRGAGSVPNTAFTHLYSYITEVEKDFSDTLNYPQPNVTLTTTPAPRTEASTEKGNPRWMIIIYIIIFTSVVVILTFLGLGIYRLKLVKALQTNRSKRLSKLERWIVCERNSIEEEMKGDSPVALMDGDGYGTTNVDGDNNITSCNGCNGDTHNGKPIFIK